MNATLRVLAVLAAAGLAATACSDVTGIKAQLKVSGNDTLTVYALNGTPAGAPTGIELSGPYTAAANANFGFSIGFDLDSTHKPVLYPVQRVANGIAITPSSVGFQFLNQSYDDITRAPGGQYQYDSTYALAVGQPVVAEVYDQTRCAYSYTYAQTYYAKFMIVSVDTAQRSMKVLVTSDPNCGYRSLVSGTTPKD